MARRRIARGGFVGSHRTANRSWSSLVNTGTSNIATDTKVLLGSFSLSNPGIDETILRTVGSISVSSDQTAASEN